MSVLFNTNIFKYVIIILLIVAIFIVIGAIKLYKENPFKYPYMNKEIDVSGKKSPMIFDYIDKYLNENGMHEIDMHNKKIEKWKMECEEKISKSLFKNHRKEQYQSILDDNGRFQFKLYRTRTKYKQVNYVKKAYKAKVIVQQYGISYEKLLARYSLLKNSNLNKPVQIKDEIITNKIEFNFSNLNGGMNLEEYQKVKNLNYLEYCDYLQKKHGIGKYNYFNTSWNKNKKCTRTSEGLICHHKCEDRAIMLSNPMFARKNPYEYQEAKNLIYCDYLEHLYLHILICENPSPNKNDFEEVGIGGVINFIVPELNDLYSGYKTNQEWRRNCHNLVINNKDVYLELLKRFKRTCKNNPFYDENCLFTSFNDAYGLWSKKNNEKLFKEIKKL